MVRSLRPNHVLHRWGRLRSCQGHACREGLAFDLGTRNSANRLPHLSHNSTPVKEKGDDRQTSNPPRHPPNKSHFHPSCLTNILSSATRSPFHYSTSRWSADGQKVPPERDFVASLAELKKEVTKSIGSCPAKTPPKGWKAACSLHKHLSSSHKLLSTGDLPFQPYLQTSLYLNVLPTFEHRPQPHYFGYLNKQA